MRYLGISALSHDASLTLIEDDKVLFAAHAERYSRVKNDLYLNQQIVDEALKYGEPDVVVWYERPLLKKTRQAFAGQWSEALSFKDYPSRYLKQFGLHRYPLEYVNHHESHALGSALTSGFDDAVVIVMDAIGEWSTFSIGHFQGTKINWLKEQIYPHSLGLLYTAFTERCGCKPNEEEYILMGMSAFGEPRYVDDIFNDFVQLNEDFEFELKDNLHCGIGNWNPAADKLDLAASIQAVTEKVIMTAVKWGAENIPSKKLILTGGVALNCVANAKVAKFWDTHSGAKDNIWVLPNPGDAGSSLGAAAIARGKPVSWQSPYLGTLIDKTLEIDEIVKRLASGEVVGLAHGRAEFGPRALGNRSLLADPRGQEMKDRVNSIKRREKFRPFAPVIMEEYADEYFEMYVKSAPYMQYTLPCKDPETFKAIVHVDGSSRVQTVNQKQNPVLYELLDKFRQKTNCPMLLNTSLNIKGEPLVDTWQDAERFSEKNKVPVY